MANFSLRLLQLSILVYKGLPGKSLLLSNLTSHVEMSMAQFSQITFSIQMISSVSGFTRRKSPNNPQRRIR